MTATKSTLTAESVHKILEYNPETGIFTYRISRGRGGKVGAIAGSLHSSGYIFIGRYKAHRLAWLYVTGVWPNEIDHINGVKHDNRWSNLRETTHSINMQNQYKVRRHNKSTGVLGVYAVGDKFQASIRTNGVLKFLGYFKTTEEAHAAYLEAKRKFHPECMLITRR